MYRIKIIYSDKNHVLDNVDDTYYVENINDEFENNLTNHLKEKGKEVNAKDALIYVDLVEKENPVYVGEMEQVCIYRANNINNNLILRKIYSAPRELNEDEILTVLNVDKYKDFIKRDKKNMKIGGGITLSILVTFFILVKIASNELKVSDYSEVFNFISNELTLTIGSGGTALGILLFITSLFDYYKDKKKLKNEELKLTK